MKKNLIQKIISYVVVLGILTACFCACSNAQLDSEEEIQNTPIFTEIECKEDSGLEEIIEDQKAPEGTLLTYFIFSSGVVLPDQFVENVMDESPVTVGFRNVELMSDDPTNFQVELPVWTADADCYEETGVDGETLIGEFIAEEDGLYSMEVVGVDIYGNASVVKVYVLYVTETVSASWLEEPQNAFTNGFDRGKAEEAFKAVNDQRTAYGLQPLSWDESLYELACVRAEEIVTSFSHQRPDGSYVGDVIIRQYGASGCGENIAANYQSITNLINGWMNSSGHRETMLDVRFFSGVMACYSFEGTYYWVNLFKQ